MGEAGRRTRREATECLALTMPGHGGQAAERTFVRRLTNKLHTYWASLTEVSRKAI